MQENKYITCVEADRLGIRFKAVNGRMCEYAAAAAACVSVNTD